MKKRSDKRVKTQKQFRLSEEVKNRLEAAQRQSGLTGEDFIVHCLDALEQRNDLTVEQVLAAVRTHWKD